MCGSQLNRLHRHLSLRTSSDTTMRVQLTQWDRNCVASQVLSTSNTEASVFVWENRRTRPKINYSKRLSFGRHNWKQHMDWRDRPAPHKLEYRPCHCTWYEAVVFPWHSAANGAAVHWTTSFFQTKWYKNRRKQISSIRLGPKRWQKRFENAYHLRY